MVAVWTYEVGDAILGAIHHSDLTLEGWSGCAIPQVSFAVRALERSLPLVPGGPVPLDHVGCRFPSNADRWIDSSTNEFFDETFEPGGIPLCELVSFLNKVLKKLLIRNLARHGGSVHR